MSTKASVRCLVVAAMLVAATVYLAKASRAEVVPPRETLATLPLYMDDWVGRREPDLTPAIVGVLGVDDYVLRTYLRRTDGVMAGLYVGYHETQRQGDTIHSPLNCLPGAGWLPVEQSRIRIPVRREPTGTAAAIEVNRVIIGKGLERQLVLYWYQSHRRSVASEYWGKVYTVLDAVEYNRTDAALVRIIVPITSEFAPELAEKQAVSFVQSLFPLLMRHFPA